MHCSYFTCSRMSVSSYLISVDQSSTCFLHFPGHRRSKLCPHSPWIGEHVKPLKNISDKIKIYLIALTQLITYRTHLLRTVHDLLLWYNFVNQVMSDLKRFVSSLHKALWFHAWHSLWLIKIIHCLELSELTSKI